MIGQTISHYKILEKLGEGGMGVVYKAQDSQLNRTVALKFLPDRVNNDSTAKARFLQEAQAAAGLNHPNICTIHGVEEHEGALFMVMEYIEGGTLREKIPFTKVDDAVTIATQIGDALQEAHAKGIVHRDIKADNIMLSSKGQAKVMDFGLAKLKGAMKLTRTSSTVGTLGYMAPEQIQGGEVDHRSDIFSFGVLLFEMLTGKLPFRGEHEAAMIYSIVNEDPQDISQLLPDLSPIVVNLIQRCLEKDPNDRFHHFEDIVADLRRSQKKTSRVMRSTAGMPVQHTTERPVSGFVSQQDMPTMAPPKKNSILLYGGIGAAVVIVAIAVWFLVGKSGITVNPDMKATVLEVPFTQYSYASLSPDAKWVAFPAADALGKWDIYFMHIDGGDARKITNDATSFIQQSAMISPDGGIIAYEIQNTKNKTIDIFSISALGGARHLLAQSALIPKWRPDGKRIGIVRTPRANIRSESGMMEFWTVAADGSDLRREFVDSIFITAGNNYRFGYCWSPDGNSIGWIRSNAAQKQSIIIHSLNSGNERALTPGDENIDDLSWTKDDRIIFSSNRGGNSNLWAIPASGGDAVQITKGAGPDIGISVAASGNDLLYLQQQRVGYVWRANADGSSSKQISFDERNIVDASFSPDKSSIAFIMNDADPLSVATDLYIMDRDGNNRRRLTNGSRALLPEWSPDGSMVAYIDLGSIKGGNVQAFVVNVANAGTPKVIGIGRVAQWLDNDHIMTAAGVQSFINSVSESKQRKFFRDSTIIWSIINGRRMVFFDWHTSTRGWWIVDIKPTDGDELWKQSGDAVMPSMTGSPKKIDGLSPLSTSVWTSTISSSGKMLQDQGSDAVKIYSFAGNRVTGIVHHYPGLQGNRIYLSSDGNEVSYVAPRLSSKLVLLQNVFK